MAGMKDIDPAAGSKHSDKILCEMVGQDTEIQVQKLRHILRPVSLGAVHSVGRRVQYIPPLQRHRLLVDGVGDRPLGDIDNPVEGQYRIVSGVGLPGPEMAEGLRPQLILLQFLGQCILRQIFQLLKI